MDSSPYQWCSWSRYSGSWSSAFLASLSCSSYPKKERKSFGEDVMASSWSGAAW